jgi:hypothetical protein
MPWTGSTIQSHNKSLHGEKAAHAARIANAVLKSSGDEGVALAVAAKWAKQHRAKGGSLLPARRRASGGPAPQAPTYQTAAPAVNAQGFVPVPQGGTYNLDLTTGAMQPASSNALRALAQRGLPIKDPNAPPPSQAQTGMDQLKALGLQPGDPRLWANWSTPGGSEGGGGGFDGGGQNASDNGGLGGLYARGGRRAGGGPAPMPMSQATPWWTRSEARGEEAHPTSGLIQGPSGGRQDNVSMNLPAHSHVIPADVVAGWGQGNNSAGALALQHAMSTGPYGTALPRVPTRPPRALSPARMPKLARGGSSDGVHTLVSHGEVIVSPSDVSRIGGGDYDKGHDWIDRLIVDSRKQIIAHQRKLAPPVRE